MQPKLIDATFSLSAQITPGDLQALAASGIRSIICNRPDREDIGQPSFRDLEAAAKEAGVEAAYLPIAVGKLTPDDVIAFGRLLEALPKPILGFCRTGTRAATLWALSKMAAGRPASEVLAATTGAGYDLSGAVARYAQSYPTAARRQ